MTVILKIRRTKPKFYFDTRSRLLENLSDDFDLFQAHPTTTLIVHKVVHVKHVDMIPEKSIAATEIFPTIYDRNSKISFIANAFLMCKTAINHLANVIYSLATRIMVI